MVEWIGSLLRDSIFTILVLTTVIPAVLVSTTQNIVRSASWLLLSLSGAAGLFFYLGADFVGATQLLIYVGGTLVLVVFGVMLTATGPFVSLASRGSDWGWALIAGLALVGVFGAILMTDRELSRPTESKGSVTPVTTNRIGLAFLGIRTDAPPTSGVAKIPNPQTGKLPSYLLPFEIISVHLVVVLIGAGYLARAKRRNPAIDVEAT